MENKIAVLAIIVNDFQAVETVNSLLHEFREYVVGRMGIPYRLKNVNIISVVLDAPAEKINSLSGKLGMISGVSSKVLTAK
ncbi:MAG: iron-only hydrogenase system regulator [Clostridia bacterium]|nr:iron-only hydrogenase system regulator [Clostridia bacterium]